jgi:hypothetical protein
MKLTLNVDTGDGPYLVSTSLYVIVQWERKYKRKSSTISEQGISIEDLAFMAYESSKIAGITVPAVLDDFIRRLVVLEVVDNDPANPTQAEPTAIP